MHLSAYAANTLWQVTSVSAAARFRRALADPGRSQRRKLSNYLRINAETAFGVAHDFGAIRSYEEFAGKVPLLSYQDLEPWIDRIRKGERNILTRSAPTHFAPTSGTSSGCKLIPFTRELQAEFASAVGVWMCDLFARMPQLKRGPAYWSVTPAAAITQRIESAIPVGFEEDSSYLGGFARRIVDCVMAVPGAVARTESMEVFWRATASALLRCEDLRLISVWHPSFLTILWEYIRAEWKSLLRDLGKDMPERADAIVSAATLQEVWKNLTVVSCWGDAAAEQPFQALVAAHPGIGFQAKGLIATEGLVSIPWQGSWPIAVDTHFYEFIDASGNALVADELAMGEEYEVVLTTAGGLWRYRLGDRVCVEGYVGKTPSVRFTGRAGIVADRFGEKLSDAFVGEVLKEIAGSCRFAMLAPETDHYTLYVEGACPAPARVDSALSANPHYRNCLELGQLKPCRVIEIRANGHAIFLRRLSESGMRLGDIKPSALSKLSGWSEWFAGNA